ncbi:MAG: type II toxin-antitoxin system VapC family toxin [Anaerolineales bacterium]|nr:type II toxin-antitoxin system VapC family toxin [Anaerolineales bacterium]
MSTASIWEMQIKAQLGRLTLTRPLAELLADQQRANALAIVPVKLAHVLALDQLPLHHRDAFDRLLIAQAMVEKLVVLSKDAAFSAYDVPVRW